MNCSQFAHWLDEGRPAAKLGVCRLHADSCPSCHDAWQAAAAIEEALSAPAPSPDPGFADRVMQRVRWASSGTTGTIVVPEAQHMPWWVEAAAQPHMAVAFILGALIVWQAGGLWALMQGLPQTLASVLSGWWAPLRSVLAHLGGTWTLFGLCLLAVPVLGWFSWQLYGWFRGLFGASYGIQAAVLPGARSRPQG